MTDWNVLNQVTASDVAGTRATTYTYDAMGNRTSSTTGAATTMLSWDISNPLPCSPSTDPANDITSYRYTPQGDLLQSEHPAASYARSYHSHDALGSITDSFKADGTPTAQSTYDAFGSATDAPSSQEPSPPTSATPAPTGTPPQRTSPSRP